LCRSGETIGTTYWNGQLTGQTLDRRTMLTLFVEGIEFRARF